jgi:hypothetical protein
MNYSSARPMMNNNIMNNINNNKFNPMAMNSNIPTNINNNLGGTGFNYPNNQQNMAYTKS